MNFSSQGSLQRSESSFRVHKMGPLCHRHLDNDIVNLWRTRHLIVPQLPTSLIPALIPYRVACFCRRPFLDPHLEKQSNKQTPTNKDRTPNVGSQRAIYPYREITYGPLGREHGARTAGRACSGAACRTDQRKLGCFSGRPRLKPYERRLLPLVTWHDKSNLLSNSNGFPSRWTHRERFLPSL